MRVIEICKTMKAFKVKVKHNNQEEALAMFFIVCVRRIIRYALQCGSAQHALHMQLLSYMIIQSVSNVHSILTMPSRPRQSDAQP